MRLGRWFGIPVRVNPAAIPLAAAAIWLGEGMRLGVMTGSILIHELMHLAAARLLRIRIVELELMPVGGAARLENFWQLRPGQMMLVALAGPASNLLMMVISAAMCWWGLLPPLWTALLVEQNAVILLFNLIPALPMDGGRILCGWLSRRMSAAGAARLGEGLSGILAAGLIAAAGYGLFHGRMNITLPMAAVFLILSARRERKQAGISAIESLSRRVEELSIEKVLPVRWLAVNEETTVRDAAMELKPRYVHRMAVYDGGLRLVRVVEETELIGALVENSEKRMKNVKSIKIEKRG